MLLALALSIALQDGTGLAPLPIPRAADPAAARHAALPPPDSPPANQPTSHLAACLAAVDTDATGAIARAQGWLAEAKGPVRAGAYLCLGTAYVAEERWDDAQAAFTAGRDAAAPQDAALRARLGLMAGNAALAGGAPAAALAALDTAKGDADTTGDAALTGALAVDRARALVLLQRPEEAASALATARAAQPGDATTWLLSATLARRMHHLAEAQGAIETAAKLAPTDPEVGLEAGVIAELAGHEEAARKDWQSVATADPEGPVGRQAKEYLAQTDVQIAGAGGANAAPAATPNAAPAATPAATPNAAPAATPPQN